MAYYSAAAWLQKYLIDQNIGTDPDVDPIGAWPIFLDGMPDGAGTPDDAIALFDTAGRKQGRYMRGGRTILFPGVMAHTRAILRNDSYNKMVEILNSWDALLRAGVTIDSDSVTIQAVTVTSSILSMGEMPGDVRRFGFSLNAIVSFSG